MTGKDWGFSVYNRVGSIVKLIASESEMQTVFSTVLKAFDKEQSTRFGGEPVDEENVASLSKQTGNVDSASSRPSATATGYDVSADRTKQTRNSASENDSRRDNRRKSKDRKAKAKQSPSEPKDPPAASSLATRRSRRRSSGGGLGSDEGLVSLTYSYGNMEWDAIESCWKPKTITKRMRRKSEGGTPNGASLKNPPSTKKESPKKQMKRDRNERSSPSKSPTKKSRSTP